MPESVAADGKLTVAATPAAVPLGFVVGALYLWLARPDPRTLAAGALVPWLGIALSPMLAAGATRIGTSSTTALVAEAEQRQAEGTLVVPTAGTDPVLVTEQTGY